MKPKKDFWTTEGDPPPLSRVEKIVFLVVIGLAVGLVVSMGLAGALSK